MGEVMNRVDGQEEQVGRGLQKEMVITTKTKREGTRKCFGKRYG